jgi:hypothetical protein
MFTKEWIRNSYSTISIALLVCCHFRTRQLFVQASLSHVEWPLAFMCVGKHGRDQGHSPRFTKCLTINAAYKNFRKIQISGYVYKISPDTEDTCEHVQYAVAGSRQTSQPQTTPSKSLRIQNLWQFSFPSQLTLYMLISSVKTASLKNLRMRF